MNSQIANMLGSIAGGDAGPSQAVVQNNVAGLSTTFGGTSGGRFDIGASVSSADTAVVGHLTYGTLLLLTIAAVSFYIWTRNDQGGG